MYFGLMWQLIFIFLVHHKSFIRTLGGPRQRYADGVFQYRRAIGVVVPYFDFVAVYDDLADKGPEHVQAVFVVVLLFVQEAFQEEFDGDGVDADGRVGEFEFIDFLVQFADLRFVPLDVLGDCLWA